MLMVEVPALRERPAPTALHTDVPEVVSVQVPDPIFKVLATELFEANLPAVTEKLLASKVPTKRDSAELELRVKLSASETKTPTPLIITAPSVFPLLVITPEL